MPDSVPFTLRQLELFCAAADRGSFAAAAAELFVTPNAVASAVGDLEGALDAHLCVRQRARGVTLTPAGVQLRARARRLLQDAGDIYGSISEHGDRLRGPVRIGCYSTLAATVLPPLLESVHQRYPEIELSFVDGTVTELVPLLRAGEVDALISYDFGLPPDLDQIVLSHTEVHILLPAEHRLAASTSISLDEIAGEPLILLDLPPSGDHTLSMLNRVGARPQVAYRSSNFELVRSLVARGFGYSLLIQKPAIDESYEGRRVLAKSISPSLSLESVVLSWPQSMRLSDRARAVVDSARSAVTASQWRPRTADAESAP